MISDPPISSENEPSQTSSAIKVDKPQHRKGRAAKGRDAEKFRIKKNEQFDKKLQQRFDDIRDTNVEQLFGQRQFTRVLPVVETTVSVDTLAPLCNLLVDTLYDACKIPPADRDVDKRTLLLVSLYQIEAKCWYAKAGTGFGVEDGRGTAGRVKAALPDNIFPVSFYIEQIGKVMLDGQVIVPSTTGNNLCRVVANPGLVGCTPATLIPADVAMRMIGMAAGGSIIAGQEHRAFELQIIDAGGVLTPAFVANPNGVNWQGVIAFGPVSAGLPDFPQLVDAFNNFLGRVTRRIQAATVPLQLGEAKGTTSQLVTSEILADQLAQVWSNRNISDDSLMAGCILGFGDGLVDTHDSHSRDFRVVEATFETAGALAKFVTNVTNKLR